MRKAMALIISVIIMLSGCAPSPPLDDAQETPRQETAQETPQATDEDGRQEIARETPQAADENRGEPDFENGYWGASMEEVRKNESGGYWLLQTPSSFAGIGAVAYYFFDRDQDDVLLAGEYKLLPQLSSLGSAAAYETARAYLADIYGEPVFEEFCDNDNEELQSIAEAVECEGDAQAVWTYFDSDGKPEEAITLYYKYGDVRVAFHCLTIHPDFPDKD